MVTEKTEDCQAKLSNINTLQKKIMFSVNGEEYELEAESRMAPIKLKKGT